MAQGMPGPGGGSTRGGGGAASSPSSADELARLRNLLVGPERQEIAQVKERLDHLNRVAPDELAPVLPQAIIQSKRESEQIAEAMLPVVEDDLSLSVKRHPDKLADLLFPVMGPAIRKAIRETMASMIQSINQTIDHAISPRGLQWRWEARQSGRTFAEVVFAHTMLYRVEQVFLIHRKTGLLLQHVAAPNAPVADPDMVSGMLTAIRDFVRDSFRDSQTDPGDDDLATLEVGDMNVWIVPGPEACVAGVIRGQAPRDLRSVFHVALEDIHREQFDQLAAFSGDTSEFALARPHLEGCLQFQADPTEAAAAAKRKIQPAYVLGALVLALAATAAFFYIRTERRWNGLLDAFRAQPGLVVTDARHGWWSSSLTGLRDPMAADPQTVIANAGLDPSKIASTWTPYQALEPPFILARAKRLLAPPDTVAVALQPDGVLEASGLAPASWIADARKLALAVPGVTQFKGDGLIDERWAELQRLRDKVQVYNILFAEGWAQPLPSQKAATDALAADVARAVALGRTTGRPVAVEVVGHTDGSGAEAINRALSLRRAESVRAILAQRLPRDVRLTAKGVAAGDPLREEKSPEDRAWNRRVTVVVTVVDAQDGEAR